MAVFHFRQFDVDDRECGMKICSDSVLLGAWFFTAHPGARRILDVGAGSGLLSLIGAQYCKGAKVTGVELDPAAAAVCSFNFGRSPWPGRLDTVAGSFADYVPSEAPDLIVSNPPYFANGEKAPDARRATARHQTDLTYRSLIAYAARYLDDDGHLGLVAPAELEDSIIFESEIAGLKLARLCRVRTSPRKPASRILVDLASGDTIPATDEIAIRSERYISLVQDLYTKIN